MLVCTNTYVARAILVNNGSKFIYNLIGEGKIAVQIEEA